MYGAVRFGGLSGLSCVYSKEYRRGPKLVACLYNENRVVIYDLETGEQKEIEIKWPLRCVSSHYRIAITTYADGLHLFSTDGVLVHIVPDSNKSRCAAFHPRNSNILAIGHTDGTMRIWDVCTEAYVSSFKVHAYGISNIRFSPDCQLFLFSADKTALIITFDAQYQISSSVKLEGHTDWIGDILPLVSSNQWCVTCSYDRTIKVWDCETGACLRTLTVHTNDVVTLALRPNGQRFASGSRDRSVIIWSCETLEVLRCIPFPSLVPLLAFGESDTLYVGVYEHGVMSCNALTGELGPVIISGTGSISGLILGKLSPVMTPKTAPLTHTRNSTVPALKPWTSSTHALWPLPALQNVHMAVVVLWKVRYQGRLMQLPYELVEIILRHAKWRDNIRSTSSHRISFV
jgi:WD40 repeat protein